MCSPALPPPWLLFHVVCRYYLATKKTPPEAASVGLILCVLHHTYDRMLALQHYAGWRGKPY